MPEKRMECFTLLLEHLAWNRASVFEWHKRFKEGRESVRYDERCGRSKEVRTPELIGQIKNFMDKDRCVSIETISAQFDVSVGTVYTTIRQELKMGRFAWPRDQETEFPVGACWLSQTQEGQKEANLPTNFWWCLFLTALAWSTCTGLLLDRQSTRNTLLRF